MAFRCHFVPLEVILEPILVSFPATSWSFCHVLCYCGTFLCIFGPSKRLGTIKVPKKPQNRLKTCVSALQLVHKQSQKNTFRAHFLSQNGVLLRLFGAQGLSKQPKQASKRAQNTSTGTPRGLGSFWKKKMDPFLVGMRGPKHPNPRLNRHLGRQAGKNHV